MRSSKPVSPSPCSALDRLPVNTVKVDPHVFAHGIAVMETLVAIALIFGVLSNLTYVGGALMSIVIWFTAEGFGGPYTAWR